MYVVRLDLRLMCRAVSLYLAALFAFMNDDIALLRVRLHPDRAHDTAARICPVAGVYIDMERAKTARAMISRAVAKRLNLKTAIFTDKRIIVFGKKLLLHFLASKKSFLIYYATENKICQGFFLTFAQERAILQMKKYF